MNQNNNEDETLKELGSSTLLHNEDCLSWMKTQPNESIDICISSPPYNIGIQYNQYGDKMKQPDYIEWQKNVWIEVCRLLKPDGHLFLNIGPTRKDPLLPYKIASNVPWKIQNSIVWSKCIEIDGYVRGHGVVTASQRYLPNGHEMVFHFTKDGNTPINIKGSSVPYQPAWAAANTANTGRDYRPTVNNWHIGYENCGSFGNNKQAEWKGEKKHPAIYPRELVRHCIKMTEITPNKIVFDPFVGTGTTLVVAQEFGMKVAGCEIDTDYYKFAKSRVDKETNE